jgi:hypothetical protein
MAKGEKLADASSAVAAGRKRARRPDAAAAPATSSGKRKKPRFERLTGASSVPVDKLEGDDTELLLIRVPASVSASTRPHTLGRGARHGAASAPSSRHAGDPNRADHRLTRRRPRPLARCVCSSTRPR